MGEFVRSVANTVRPDAVLVAMKQAFGPLKYDGTDGSFINTSPVAGQLQVRVTFPDAQNPNITNVAFDAAVATAQANALAAETETSQVRAALNALQTFRDIPTPTNAQVVNQVQLHARILQELIRRIT